MGPVENLRTIHGLEENPQVSEYLNTIEENGYRLLRLVNDILDLVKLDSGDTPLRPESINILDFITGIASDIRSVASLKGVNLLGDYSVSEDQKIWLDRDRLEKIVLNLAVNAVKFTPSEGKVIISLGIHDNKSLELAVADTGTGMSEKEIQNVFVRFWQADMSAKRKHRGAGIGLSLVKSFTESMGGNVSVKSELGKGTTFTVQIPLPQFPEYTDTDEHKQDETKDILEHFNEKARASSDSRQMMAELYRESGQLGLHKRVSSRRPKEGKKHILVADDEETMRKFIVRQLTEYELHEAPDGKAAWDLARKLQPDLIILDLMMPEIDGIEVTRKIREDKELKRTPIILVTAQTSETPRLDALKAGVNDFISKPFSTVELRVRINNLLESHDFEVQLSENNTRLEAAYDQLKEQESLLIQNEKLTSLGRMSAGIIHEINNPMNYIKTALHVMQTFRNSLPESEHKDFLDVLGDAKEGVTRVIGIVKDLRQFTRSDLADVKSVNLSEVIESARRLTSASLSEISFITEVDEALTVEGNERQLSQVFINLFQNSAHAIASLAPESKREAQLVVKSSKQENGDILLTVRDNGCGIKKEDMDHIFDPFFTKKDVGDGMGLGLSICHRILKQYNAQLSVDSQVGEFTEFSILFNGSKKQKEKH